MLSTVLLFLTLTVNPAPKFGLTSPLEQVQPADTLTLLSRAWVLREQFHAHNGQMEPVAPHEKIELTFRENGTYSLSRYYGVADAGSLEEGKWEYRSSEGAIGMQTRQVDGRAILSTMLPRWEVLELSEGRLVLRQFSLSGIYLVLESKNK